MKYFISVSNGLLDPYHRKRMGSAVWEFLWCLDRITKIDANKIGWILGGAPIKLRVIATSLGTAEASVSRNLSKLSSEGYITLTHAPYGIVIKVPNAKKRFNRSVNPQVIHRFNRNEKPSFNRIVKPRYENAKPPYSIVKPNKTVSVDKTDDRGVEIENTKVTAIKEEIKKLVSTFTR